MREFLDGLDPRLTTAAAAMGLALIAAVIARWLLLPLLVRLSRGTETDLDDQLVARLGKPVVASILLLGLGGSLGWLEEGTTLRFAVFGALKTLAVLLWSMVLAGVGVLVLGALGRHGRMIQPKTLPLFTMIWKILVYGAAAYFLLAAWNVDLTTWLASAGVAGIAVGFAAKDTLANLFAGVFIIADAPFKIGDFIVIDDVTRGEVVDIGLRSSRLLTRDDVEVTVPNAVIANAKIVNETGGPHQKMRVRVRVAAAYGSDAARVREVLLGCLDGVQHLCDEPAPRVRFRELGDSGLIYELLAWIEAPVHRGRVLDVLNERAYDALRAEGIAIPFPQMEVRVKELPG